MHNNAKRLMALALSVVLLLELTACGSNQPAADGPGPEEQAYGITVSDIDAYTAPLRPSYHYTAYDSWINDPNGLVYFDGVWHMYYQSNPGVNVWGNMTWGHAVSDDLMHWVEKEPVLFPDETGDMWSGTGYVDLDNKSGLFDETGSGIIVAYSTDTQHAGIAYSADGYNFTKLGLVLPNPGVKDFRDPKIFYHEETGKWIIVIAGGQVRIFSSDDLMTWELESINEIWTECPDLFEMTVEGTDEKKWVLTCGGRGYYIGDFDGHVFTPESEYIPMNDGPDSYAGILFNNATKGRSIMLNWIQNWAYPNPADGMWNGAMSLPVDIVLRDVPGLGLRLIQNPVEEVATLEGRILAQAENLVLDESSEDLLADVRSNTFRLDISFDVSQSYDMRLDLCTGPNDVLRIRYEWDGGYRITFDRTGIGSSIPALRENGVYSCVIPSEAIPDNILDLTIYVDISTFELFAAGGLYTLTGRIQPFTASQGMSLKTDGLALESLCVKEMYSTWFGTETGKQEYLHLSEDHISLYSLQESVVLPAYLNAVGKSTEDITWTVSDESVLTVEANENGAVLTPLSSGKAVVTASYGDRSASCSVNIIDGDSSKFQSDLGSYTVTNAAVEETNLGYYLSASGDGFLVSDRTAGNFHASADMILEQPSGALALLFHVQNLRNFYCLNIDIGAQVVKLWGRVDGNVTVFQSVPVNVATGELYQLGVSVEDDVITAYLNGEALFSVNDNSLTEGAFGLNVFSGAGYINNVTITE